jgi:hypothetical protein
MEHKGSLLPYSQEPTTGPYSEPDQSNPHLHNTAVLKSPSKSEALSTPQARRSPLVSYPQCLHLSTSLYDTSKYVSEYMLLGLMR